MVDRTGQVHDTGRYDTLSTVRCKFNKYKIYYNVELVVMSLISGLIMDDCLGIGSQGHHCNSEWHEVIWLVLVTSWCKQQLAWRELAWHQETLTILPRSMLSQLLMLWCCNVPINWVHIVTTGSSAVPHCAPLSPPSVMYHYIPVLWHCAIVSQRCKL